MASHCLPFRNSLRGTKRLPIRQDSLCNSRPSNELSDMNVMTYIRMADENPTLQKTLERNLKLRDGASRILAISHNWSQRLDAAKTLLVTNSQIMACMKDIQREKNFKADASKFDSFSTAGSITNKCDSFNSQSSFGSEDLKPPVCRGQLTLSHLRIPLLWKDGIRPQPDYHVFCLIKVDNEIRDTQLISEIGSNNYDIEFTDVINFKDVKHDFCCEIEVYGFKSRSPPLPTSASVKRFSGMMLEDTKDFNPDFELLGRATLNLNHVSEKVYSHNINPAKELGKETPRCDLPIFGNLCCRLVVQPIALLRPVCTGFLKIKEESSGTEYFSYCELQDRRLNCWQTKQCSETNDHVTSLVKPSVDDIPDFIIPIVKTSSFLNETKDLTHTLQICTFLDDEFQEQVFYRITFLTDSDLQHWWKSLHQHINDQVYWASAFEHMDVSEPTSFLRHGSVMRASTSICEDFY